MTIEQPIRGGMWMMDSLLTRWSGRGWNNAEKRRLRRFSPTLMHLEDRKLLSNTNLPTATSVSVSTVGSQVQLTATVLAPGATQPVGGTVYFEDISSQSGTFALGSAPLNKGMAALPPLALKAGTNRVLASFSGYSTVPNNPSINGINFVASTSTTEPTSLITTSAGNGTASYSGNGGAAISAGLNIPAGVALDSKGDIFVADMGNNMVREISPSGIITTIAGTGVAGYSGNGGLATNADLNGPRNVVVDSTGDVFIADTNNHAIREVSPSGVITTVAGDDIPGFAGDGGLATRAELYNPTSIALNGAGDLFIADSDNNRIREVSTQGIITTIAGIGTPGFKGDGGPATAAELWFPNGVAVGPGGDIFIADTNNRVIRQVSPSGTIRTVAGTPGVPGYSGDGGSAVSATLGNVVAVLVGAAGNIFIGDSSANVVREVSPQGVINTVAGDGTAFDSGDGGPADEASLYWPISLAMDSTGDLYIADAGNNRVREVIVALRWP